FSSRRRHTRWPRDWSSDVCSSDLRHLRLWRVGRDADAHLATLFDPKRTVGAVLQAAPLVDRTGGRPGVPEHGAVAEQRESYLVRSEERRVGKGGRARGGVWAVGRQ